MEPLNPTDLTNPTNPTNSTQEHIVGYLDVNKLRMHGYNKRGLPIYWGIPLSTKYPKCLIGTRIVEPCYAIWKIVSTYDIPGAEPIPIAEVVTKLGIGPLAEDLALMHKNCLYLKSYKRLPVTAPIVNDHIVRKTFPEATIIAIDPEGSNDFDDAFHTKENCIYVHIADVDATFQSDGPYETELQARVTSIYGYTKTYHMLPEECAVEHISLNSRGDKHVITVELSYTEGQLKPVGVYLSTIRVAHNITYEEATKKKHRSMLRQLYEYTGTRDPHVAIERLMIACNTYVAKLLHDAGTPLNRICDTDAAPQQAIAIPCLSYLQHKEMGPAIYTTRKTGHRPLGLEYYTHFTSPMRRYADLMVQRLLKRILVCPPNAALDDDDNIELVLERINQYNTKVRRYYRDKNLLDLCYRVGPNPTKTYGYIVAIDDRKATIYLEEYKLEYRSNLFADKIQFIDVSTVNDTIIVTSRHSGQTVQIKKYERLELTLFTDPTQPRIQHRVKLCIQKVQMVLQT